MTRRISPAIQTERHHLKRLLTACAHLTSAGQRSAHLRTRFAHERRLRVRVGDFHCYAALSDAGEPVRGGGGGDRPAQGSPSLPLPALHSAPPHWTVPSTAFRRRPACKNKTRGCHSGFLAQKPPRTTPWPGAPHTCGDPRIRRGAWRA